MTALMKEVPVTQTHETIDIMRPLLPTAADIAPYLTRIDAARWYSNFGPLEREYARGWRHIFMSPASIS